MLRFMLLLCSLLVVGCDDKPRGPQHTPQRWDHVVQVEMKPVAEGMHTSLAAFMYIQPPGSAEISVVELPMVDNYGRKCRLRTVPDVPPDQMMWVEIREDGDRVHHTFANPKPKETK